MSTFKQKATTARKKVLDMIYKGQSSHIGSNFSCIDLLTVLFDTIDLNKDKVIFSKGWVAASAYYFLAEKGVIPKEDLETYCIGDSKYIGLVEPTVKGIEAAGGSMGYGLPFAVGFALAKKLKKEEGNVYVLMSDGEMAIGTTWESALLASQHELDNLIVIVDNNGLQAMGETRKILDISPLTDKWKAFKWEVKTVNGHNHDHIKSALEYPPMYRKWPKIIIASTIKGKGVTFMENQNLYHYKNLTEDEYKKASIELNNLFFNLNQPMLVPLTTVSP